MPELIERNNVIAYLNAQIEKVRSGLLHDYGFPTNIIASLTNAKNLVKNLPTIEAESVRHGYWIECDYKTLEHGEIESAYKAGLCCSECRTGFKKTKMTYKQFCAACGAKMGAEEEPE